ncbi:MAG: lysozyme, partial [Oscillibacter sp.]|nr:lysozyme [Oscillibacter sp.]
YQMTISDVYTPGRTTGQYITYQGSRIPIYAGVQTRNVYSGDFVWRTGHRLRYLGSRYNAQFGVDVSAYQNRDRANGTINWAAAKADGVQFAMIRVGLRGTSTGALREDAYYARNIDGAMAQGIQTGAYIFSQATTIAEAIEEADFVIARLRGHKINGPVSIDWEMKDRSYRVYGTSKEMATACAVAFCKRVAAAGYTPMVYNSRYVAYIKYDQGALAPYMMWYPQYSPTSDTYPYPNLYYQMDYWQFTDSAVVEGIGTKIDANIWFKPKG